MEIIDLTLARLKEFEPPEGYYLAFSGGKDSIVLRYLADQAKVKYDIHYNVTTIDPPELIYFIRHFHSDVIWERPQKAFLTMLVERGFPRRQGRWCCEEYKERGGSGRIVLTGIRATESVKRGKRKMVEQCMRDSSKRYVHPLIDWTERDIWKYIRKYKLPYCKLYDWGWKRIGCLFCPLAYYKHRQHEVRLYPKYAMAFRKAFCKLYSRLKIKNAISINRWSNGNDMFDWWIGDGHIDESKQEIMQFHFDSDDD